MCSFIQLKHSIRTLNLCETLDVTEDKEYHKEKKTVPLYEHTVFFKCLDMAHGAII